MASNDCLLRLRQRQSNEHVEELCVFDFLYFFWLAQDLLHSCFGLLYFIIIVGRWTHLDPLSIQRALTGFFMLSAELLAPLLFSSGFLCTCLLMKPPRYELRRTISASFWLMSRSSHVSGPLRSWRLRVGCENVSCLHRLHRLDSRRSCKFVL